MRYFYEKINPLNYIIERMNPDNAIEFQANEFRKIYYFFGLYSSFCSQAKQNDFDQFLMDNEFYSLCPDDRMQWAYLNKGVQLIRDSVIGKTVCCSGVMLRKMAYKSYFQPIAIARNADKHINAILIYVNHTFPQIIKDCFFKMINTDFVRYITDNRINLNGNNPTALKDACVEFSLTFQIIMLQNKNTQKARCLLARIHSIPGYQFICDHINNR